MMVSSCCGSEVYSECGSGEDMIGICCDCHEWCGVDDDTSLDDHDTLSVDDMIERLRADGMVVSRVPNDPNIIHVDGYTEHTKSLPDYIWGQVPGWGVSTCGFARVFMFRFDDSMRKAIEDNAMSMEEYNLLPPYRG